MGDGSWELGVGSWKLGVGSLGFHGVVELSHPRTAIQITENF